LLRLTSQPFAALASQFAKGAVHAATVQALAAQPAVPFATEQTFPQAPQLFASVLVLVSQPSA
jgi:hypothetical protein